MTLFENGPRTPTAAEIVCLPLPVTGSSLIGILGVALALAFVGALLLFAGRRGRRVRSAALLAGALLLPAPLLVSQSEPAAAASTVCPPGTTPSPAGPHQPGVPTGPNGPVTPTGPTIPSSPAGPSPTGTVRVTVVQVSANTGMAPGVAPTTLVGQVRNPSNKTVYVKDVVVAITGVTKARNAVAGTCGASDYRLTDRRMPVSAVLEPGQKANFSGARIGFFNKSVNQDACKGATVSLGYTSS